MKADLIIYSNAIFDAVSDEPFSGGIAISGKKIIAIGSKEEIQKFEGEDTDIRSFKDQLVMPGFVDSHGHYDITLNSSRLGIDGCVKMIEHCVKEKLGVGLPE